MKPFIRITLMIPFLSGTSHRLSAVLAVALILVTGSVRAQTIINENWESYTPGSAVASPWVQTGGGGTTPAVSADTVVNTTINSVTSNWGLINNAATDEPASNPGLKSTFTATSAVLSLSLQYSIPANYGNSSQLMLSLNSGSTVGISMVLGHNWARNGMAYINSAGTNTGIGHTFSAGETITLSLANINITTSTYDITWSSSTGASGSITGATFTHAVTSFDTLTIGESSPVTGTSQLYLDNILLQAVPEPGSLSLLGMCFSVGLGRLMLRRKLLQG